jgi:hypothetical protein
MRLGIAGERLVGEFWEGGVQESRKKRRKRKE